MQILWIYVRELLRFAKGKLVLDLWLVIILGLCEGVGILMLMPLLSFAGIGSENSPEVAGLAPRIGQLLHFVDISYALPVVLIFYSVVIAGQSWLQRYEAILSVTIQETFDTMLSTSLYEALTSARWSFFLTIQKARITHVITTELLRVSTGTHYFMQLLASSLLGAMHICLALLVAPLLTLMVMLCGLLLFGCLHFLVREARRMGMDISDFTGDLYTEVTEHFNGIKEVKSYGIEPLQVDNFKGRRRKVEQTFIDFVKMQSRTAMYYKIGAAIFISLFYYAGIEIFKLNAQELLIIMVIFARLWPKFSALQEGLQYVMMMLPAFQAVMELRAKCTAEAETPVLQRAETRLPLKVGLRLCDVTFRYGANTDRFAVQRINCLMPAGTTTAVVGISGAGKSTLADLIIGLLVPERGEILVDDVRLDSGNIYAWRQSIGYVPQDAFLFNARIRDNLLWACSYATEDDIWEALKMAAIDDFVRNLPEKLDTVVGDRGIRLSGGERQRIVLARALLRKPELLILDEATSALDGENEKRIQQAIEGLQGKLTILIIAHRMSTVSHADRIIVLEQGRIVEQGSYRTCASDKNSRFYKLACL